MPTLAQIITRLHIASTLIILIMSTSFLISAHPHSLSQPAKAVQIRVTPPPTTSQPPVDTALPSHIPLRFLWSHIAKHSKPQPPTNLATKTTTPNKEYDRINTKSTARRTSNIPLQNPNSHAKMKNRTFSTRPRNNIDLVQHLLNSECTTLNSKSTIGISQRESTEDIVKNNSLHPTNDSKTSSTNHKSAGENPQHDPAHKTSTLERRGGRGGRQTRVRKSLNDDQIASTTRSVKNNHSITNTTITTVSSSLLMNLTNEGHSVRVSWIINPSDSTDLDLVQGFVVSYRMEGRESYDSSRLGKGVRSFFLHSLHEDKHYRICIQAIGLQPEDIGLQHMPSNLCLQDSLLNAQENLVAELCRDWSKSSMKMVVGVMAGLIFLVPCLVVVVLVIYKDRQMTALELNEESDLQTKKRSNPEEPGTFAKNEGERQCSNGVIIQDKKVTFVTETRDNPLENQINPKRNIPENQLNPINIQENQLHPMRIQENPEKIKQENQENIQESESGHELSESVVIRHSPCFRRREIDEENGIENQAFQTDTSTRQAVD